MKNLRKRAGYEILTAIYDMMYVTGKKSLIIKVEGTKIYIKKYTDEFTISLVAKPNADETIIFHKDTMRAYKEDGIFVDGRSFFSSELKNLEDVLTFKGKKYYSLRALTSMIENNLNAKNIAYKVNYTMYSNYIVLENGMKIRVSDHTNNRREGMSENNDISRYIFSGLYDEKELTTMINHII